jgi:hypothetical protein
MTTAEAMERLKTLAQAMGDLQRATGDATLGHAVGNGKFQIQRVTYNDKGRATVEPVGPFREYSDHLDAIRLMIEATP